MVRSAGPSRSRSSATKSFEEALGEPLATTVSLTTSTSLATTATSDQRAEDEHYRGSYMRERLLGRTLFGSFTLPLASRRHFTTPPSAKRYGDRYEAKR